MLFALSPDEDSAATTPATGGRRLVNSGDNAHAGGTGSAEPLKHMTNTFGTSADHIAAPKSRRATAPRRNTASGIEINIVAAAAPDGGDDSDDSELASVVRGRARSPSDALHLPPSPPPSPRP
jgi:hypothetical protein